MELRWRHTRLPMAGPKFVVKLQACRFLKANASENQATTEKKNLALHNECRAVESKEWIKAVACRAQEQTKRCSVYQAPLGWTNARGGTVRTRPSE
jgi:hypothetical protein